MAKFLPIIGEIYTGIESAVLITSAGVAKVCGDDKGAKKMANAAGNAWKEYSETNLIAAPVKLISLDIQGKHCERLELKKSFGNIVSSFVDGIPVVGHTKGIIHYALGDKERGHKAIEASTRSTAVLGAGIATGGLGGGLALGAIAGLGTGVAYDATATGIDKAVNGKDSPLHGHMNLANADKMNPNEIISSVFGVVGDAMTGMGGAKMGKALRAKHIAKKTGQRRLQNTYKNSKKLKKTGVDYRTATKQTMETAKESKNARATLSKKNNFATSKVVDKTTKKSGVGHSAKFRVQARKEGVMPRGPKGVIRNDYGKPSLLQRKHPYVKQAPNRNVPQAACAEHPAFDQLSKKSSTYSAKNVNTITVFNNNGDVQTAARCGNCALYGDKMGIAITDCIPDRTPVPVPDCGYINDSNIGQRVAVRAATALGGVRKHVSLQVTTFSGIETNNK